MQRGPCGRRSIWGMRSGSGRSGRHGRADRYALLLRDGPFLVGGAGAALELRRGSRAGKAQARVPVVELAVGLARPGLRGTARARVPADLAAACLAADVQAAALRSQGAVAVDRPLLAC